MKLTSLHWGVVMVAVLGLARPHMAKANNDDPKNSISTESTYAPTFSNCPSDQMGITPVNGECTAQVFWTPPTATGTGTVTVSSNYNSGDYFYPGTHRVVYRATDDSGVTSYCTFTVEVLDNQDPEITVPADISVFADPGSCGAVVYYTQPTVTDNCPAGTGESPLEENFERVDSYNTMCYVFDGTQIGTDGNINGSPELETSRIVSFDARTLTMPLTQFNGTGEIFFDHKVNQGAGNLTSRDTRITVYLEDTAGNSTAIFTKQYVDENVATEYIPITVSGNYYVRFEFTTNDSKNDVAFLDDIYIPGYVTANESGSGKCGAASLNVVKINNFSLDSGSEFPVGTTTMRYFSEDASGNIAFNEFDITVSNNINPPTGYDVTYCEGDPIPAISASVSTNQTVDWYNTPSGGTLLASGTNTYQPTAPGTYYAETRNTTTGCVSATRTPINVIENPKPDAPIAASPIEYCLNDTAVALTATGESGNDLFWYDASTGGNMYGTAPTPDTSVAGTTYYYVEQVDASTGCVSDRTEVEVTVYALPTNPTVTSPVVYCVGDTADELNDSATGTQLRWYTAQTGGTEIPGTTRPDTSTAGTQYFWVSQSQNSGSSTCESERTMLTVEVSNPPAITTQPADQNLCAGETATFTSAANNSTVYQWQEFNGSTWTDIAEAAPYSGVTSTTLTITNAPSSLNNYQYRLVASNNAPSCGNAISNAATLQLNAQPAAPTVSNVDYCQYDTATALTASGSNLLWYTTATGGTGSTTAPTPDTNTAGNTSYYVTQTNASGCESPRAEIVVTVYAQPSAPTANDVTYCQNDTPSALTATGSNLLWYTAATGGTGSTTAPTPSTSTVGTTSYFVSQSNANGCESPRTEIVVTVNSLPTAPTASDVTYCQNDTATPLTATGSNLLWYTTATGGTGTATAPTPDTSAVGNTSYFVSQTNANGCEGPRTEVVVTVNAQPNAPTVSNVDYCQYDTATALTASGSNLLWYTTATGGTGSTTAPTPDTNTAGNTSYFVTQTNASGCESPRAELVVTVYAQPSAPTANDVTYCQNDTPSALTATGSNLLWYTAATGGTGSTTAPTPSTSTVGNTSYFVSQTNANGCESPRTEIVVTVNSLPTAPTASDVTYCQNDTATPLTATGSNLLWYTVATGGTGTATAPTPDTSAVGNTSYFVSQTNANGCEGPRTEIVVTVNAQPNAPTVSNVDYCQYDTATALTASGSNLLWYTTATGGTGSTTAPTPDTNTAGNTSYFVTQTNASGCESPRAELVVTVYAQPSAPTANDVTYCQNDTPSALTATGSNLLWYTAATGGTGSTTAPTPSTSTVGNTSYFVSQTNANGCESPRTEIVVTVNSLPTAPTASDVTYCQNDTATPLTATGSNLLWYTVATGGTGTATAPTPDTSAVGNTSYFVSQTNANGCEGPRTEIVVTVNAQPTISVATAATCAPDLLTYSISVNVSTGTVTSTQGDVTDNGGNNWTIANIPSGNDIVITVEDTVNSCSNTLSVTAPNCSCPTVDEPGADSGDLAFCTGGTVPTISVTVNGGETVDWYTSPTGGSPVHSNSTSYQPSSTDLSEGTNTFYAEARNTTSNCISSTRRAVTITQNALPNAPTVTDVTYCQNDTATALTATGSNLLWYTVATGGTGDTNAPTPDTSSAGTTSYYVSQTNANGCEGPRAEIVVTINALPTAPTASDVTYCQNDTATALTATGSNLLWYIVASGGTGDTNAPTPDTSSAGTTSYYVSQTNANGCESPRTEIVVNVNPQPTISVATAATCAPDLLTYSISVNVSTGTVTSTQGDVTDNGGNNWTIANIPSGNDIVITVEDTTNSCINTLSITAPDCSCPVVNEPGEGSGDVAFCTGGTVPSISVVVNPGETVDWYTTPTGGTPVHSNSTSYQPSSTDLSEGTNTFYAEARNTTSDCISSTRRAVTITQNALPNAPTVTDVTYCQNDTATALTATGSNLLWYTVATGGTGDTNAPTPDTSSAATTSYYVSQTNANGCEGPRAEIIVTINALPTVVANATATTINAGESVTLTGSGADSYTWDMGVQDGDSVTPLVTTTYTVVGTDANGCQNTHSITITVGETSDLRLEKTVDASEVAIGDTVTFSITVTNDGPTEDPGNATVTDILPNGFTYVADSGSAANGTYDASTGIWTLPAIPNTQSVRLDIFATVNAPSATSDTYTNTAEITSATNYDPDSHPGNDDGDQSEDDEDTATVRIITSDLSVEKDLSPNSNLYPLPGDIVSFTITLNNEGPDEATNVTLTDVVPSGFTLYTIGDGGSLSQGNIISWQFANVPVGSQSVTYEATLNEPTATTGEYTNIVQVTASDQYDPDSTPNNDDGDQSEDDEAAYTINNPSLDLDIAKTVMPEQAIVGDTIAFTVSVYNSGVVPATNIGIEDVLPSGYIMQSVTTDVGAYNTASATWEIPQLDAGITGHMQMMVTVTEEEDYTNIASLIYVDQIDTNMDNDSQEATVIILEGLTEEDCTTVYNEFTPNGDGANDYLFIDCIDQYPNNNLQIFNRWGSKVYEKQGYDNTWTGVAQNASGVNANQKLTVGTYYYLLDLGDGVTPVKTGWIYITR